MNQIVREAINLLGDQGRIAEDISLAIDRELKGLTYLGPLRREPQRDYRWNGAQPGTIGVDGHGTIDALLAGSRSGRSRHNRNILNSVSEWLKRMKLADDGLSVPRLGSSSHYEVVVDPVNLRDVGIGISQVLLGSPLPNRCWPNCLWR